MKDTYFQKKHHKPIKTNTKKETGDFKLSELNKDEDLLEELEKELARKDEEITQLKEKLTNTQERLLDIIQEKKYIEQIKTELELKETELKLKKFQKLENKHHQLSHRSQVTKKHLDQARAELKIQEKVITDLENRRLLDYLLGRFPESFQDYQKK
jgi:DNA repair exonuclease SbcCD ATPase subunit